MSIKPIHLNTLLVTLVILVVVPTAIVVASLLLSMANESAGWLHYRLPSIFFWMFLATGVAAPLFGIGTLLWLWMLQRRSASLDDSKTQLKVLRALVFTAVAAIVAPAAWAFAFSEVFFVSGGSR